MSIIQLSFSFYGTICGDIFETTRSNNWEPQVVIFSAATLALYFINGMCENGFVTNAVCRGRNTILKGFTTKIIIPSGLLKKVNMINVIISGCQNGDQKYRQWKFAEAEQLNTAAFFLRDQIAWV